MARRILTFRQLAYDHTMDMEAIERLFNSSQAKKGEGSK